MRIMLWVAVAVISMMGTGRAATAVDCSAPVLIGIGADSVVNPAPAISVDIYMRASPDGVEAIFLGLDKTIKPILRGHDDGKVYTRPAVMIEDQGADKVRVYMHVAPPPDAVAQKLDLEVTKDKCSGVLLAVPSVVEIAAEGEE